MCHWRKERSFCHDGDKESHSAAAAGGDDGGGDGDQCARDHAEEWVWCDSDEGNERSPSHLRQPWDDDDDDDLLPMAGPPPSF